MALDGRLPAYCVELEKGMGGRSGRFGVWRDRGKRKLTRRIKSCNHDGKSVQCLPDPLVLAPRLLRSSAPTVSYGMIPSRSMVGYFQMSSMWEPVCAGAASTLLRTVPRHKNIVEFYDLIDGVGLVIQAINGVCLDTKIEWTPFNLGVKLKWG
ncbi:hypothetical protein C8R44DRAFT_737309 [Mycena epipterygia]|nr:hypothetical protein C8R44DRAFT_737309 [Mycena epipterygia]